MEQLLQFIINHWALWVLLVSILVCIFINEQLTQRIHNRQLSPEALVALVNEDKATIFDLRDKEIYRKGHIINAICTRADDFLQKKMDQYKNKTIILVCARGVESTACATKLKAQGFNEVLVLAGGMSAWQNRDLPLVKGK